MINDAEQCGCDTCHFSNVPAFVTLKQVFELNITDPRILLNATKILFNCDFKLFDIFMEAYFRSRIGSPLDKVDIRIVGFSRFLHNQNNYSKLYLLARPWFLIETKKKS